MTRELFPKTQNPLLDAAAPKGPDIRNLDSLIPDSNLLNARRVDWLGEPQALERFVDFLRVKRSGVNPSCLRGLEATVALERQERTGAFHSLGFDAELETLVLGASLREELLRGREHTPCTLVMEHGLPRRVFISPDRNIDLLAAEVKLLQGDVPTIDGLEVLVSKHDTSKFLGALKAALHDRSPNRSLHVIGLPDQSLPDGGYALVTSILSFLDSSSMELALDNAPLSPQQLWRLCEGLSDSCPDLSCLSISLPSSEGLHSVHEALRLLDSFAAPLQSLSIHTPADGPPHDIKEPPFLPNLKRLSLSSSSITDRSLKMMLSIEETPELVTLVIDNNGRACDVAVMGEELRARDSLRSLHLSNYRRESTLEPSLFSYLPKNLEILSSQFATVCAKDISEISQLKNLERLELSWTELDDDCYQPLVTLAARGTLEELDLRSTPLSDALIEELLSASPTLRVQLTIGDETDYGSIPYGRALQLQERFGENRVSLFGEP